MKPDYKLIADNDPGGALATAYATMKAETVDSTPEKKMSYVSIANEVGFAAATALSAVIDAAVALPQSDPKWLPKWVCTAMETSGIDVNNTQTAGVLSSLVAGGFTQAMADAIIASGVISVEKYPGLTEQRLQNARDMRASGAI